MRLGIADMVALRQILFQQTEFKLVEVTPLQVAIVPNLNTMV